MTVSPGAAARATDLNPATTPARTLWAAGAAAAYFLFCVAVQFFTGAWQASFTAYPDEPSHFVGGVMIRDWLISGQWASPGNFAQNYYDHYPFFAVGYWPPAFHMAEAVAFLAAGVGRMQALLVPAACAAITAWLIFLALRRRTGAVAAVCAGALYLSCPGVARWYCAVMVDHMSACLSMGTAAALVLYLEKPSYRNGILTAVFCGWAILSKYSVAYTVALPWAAILLLRRFELVRKPSILIHPVIVAVMVAPWAVWTRHLAYYGLPSEHPVLGAARAAQMVERTLAIFPPLLTGAALLGLLGLAALPKPWRKHEDIGVFGLLGAGHLAFLFLSPVGAEPRYLLTPAACLLILGFAGWGAALSRIAARREIPAGAVPVTAMALTAVFMAVYCGRYSRPAQYPIRNIVAEVLKSGAGAGERVVMPSDLEGPFIAEFVAQERRRPSEYLLRPSKVFARSDWFGEKYSPIFRTPEEILEYFRLNPVKAVIWHEGPGEEQHLHERILKDALERKQAFCRRTRDFGAGGGNASWAIYDQSQAR